MPLLPPFAPRPLATLALSLTSLLMLGGCAATRSASDAPVTAAAATNPAAAAGPDSDVVDSPEIQRLFRAAETGDLEALDRELARGTSPTVAGPDEATPLHFAAANGHLAVVQRLLERGARADARTQTLATPLHAAAFEGHVDTLRLLLSRTQDPAPRDINGVTPLALAAHEGHLDSARALLDNNPLTPRAVAAGGGQLEMRRLLIDRAAAVSLAATRSPLHIATWEGHADIVRELIARGADPRLADPDGVTPLDLAREKKHTEIIALLEAAPSKSTPPAGRCPLPSAAILAALFAAAWVALMFYLGSSRFGRAGTQRMINSLWRTPRLAAFLDRHHSALRAAGHYVEFITLGFILYFALGLGSLAFSIPRALLAWLLTSGWAWIDEFHQSRTPGRQFRTIDFIHSLVGATLGTAAALLVSLL